MEINGVPLHPLVVHAAVVLAPAAAVAGLAYAARPGWRWLLRWPMVLLAAATAGVSYVAKLTGQNLLEKRPFLLDADPLREQIQLHQSRGNLLVWFALALLVVSVLAAWSLGGPSALASGRGAMAARGAVLTWGVGVLLVAAAVAVLVMVVLTGDAGARAVWRQ